MSAMSAKVKSQNQASQDICPLDQEPAPELCEIDLSQTENVYLNLHGKVQVSVNGSLVTRSLPVFHKDEIRLGKSDPLFVLDVPHCKRTGALQKLKSKLQNNKHRVTGQSEDDSRDQTVIFLSRSTLDLQETANYSRTSLYFNIPEILSNVGLHRGGGVTFKQKMMAKRDENGVKLGIFFWDSDTDINWLTHEIADRKIISMSCLALSWVGDQVWRSVAARCNAIVFCHSMRSGKSLYDLEMYLDHLLESHGAKNLLMVIMDLEDIMCEKGMNAQWRESQFSSIELLLFTEMEMNLLCPLRNRQMTENCLAEAKLNQIRCILQQQIPEMTSTSQHVLQSHKKHIIGIFSKADEKCFSWLKTILSTGENFRDWVKEVRQFHLATIDKKLSREIANCTFAILYHTTKQGSVKLTDVSGSIYDEELKCLSAVIGRENVIVVLDDMDRSRSVEKMRILQEQPSIDRLARDLFLFGVREKLDHAVYQTIKEHMAGEKMLQKMAPLNNRIKKRETQQSGNEDEWTQSGFNEVEDHELECEEMTDFEETPPSEEKGSNHSSPLHKVLMEGNKAHKSLQNLTMENLNMVPEHYKRLYRLKSHEAESMLDALTLHQTKHIQPPRKHVVGIFSSSPQRNYYWLQDLLKSAALQSKIQEVRYCYILESNWVPFWRGVSECTFGILYHNRRDGRSCITDVPGSLYDKHLRYLSAKLGKKNVFVLIDDMEDTSAEEKHRILEQQPSLRQLASDVLLFSRDIKPINAKDFPIK